ncbi:amino acid ABC transporter substrate-binding protein [Propionigenium maris DSM 9537]|uniref:Amino acid ABC transporter substrate-binding protein n=1 Tax=Propionigenium maris DSM 9537 TaxID=1123000 RepID=A0A9W6GKM0_9FUSO|nr:amino acid ABC transporter substrate-binding protein [Propionigenium maris]GLI55476.1 amino acid ABC transporter substrate-binding protein [Propionigenium maris DSM 9537]
MKKLVVFLLGILVLSTTALGFFGGGKDTLEKIKKEGRFVVGLDDTFAPMGFRDENGEIVGFDIDLAKEAARRMGVEAEFKPVDWDGVIFELKSKKIDMVWNGMTITEERKKQIAFSDTYYTGEQIAITRAGSDIKSISDLAGKVVGTQMGSTSYFALEKNPVFSSVKDVKKYTSNVEALLDLEAGRIEAVIIDSMVGRYYATKKETKEGKDIFAFVDDSLADEYVGIGIRREDQTLVAEINRVMDEMKADGTFDTIYAKWFGR